MRIPCTPLMPEDWRLRVDFTEENHALQARERLEAHELEHEVVARLGRRIAASRDGATLFFYADSEKTAHMAEELVRSIADGAGWSVETALTRWHEEAEDWESSERAEPETEQERSEERERLMQREDQETKEQGYADWEVRAELPSHREAREFAERLDREDVPHVRRWRYVLIGMSDEDQAREWADRLRQEAPAGTEVSVEGTFASSEHSRPFSFLGGLGGAV
jgi:superfamily II DNA/RNA helicase